LDQERPLGVSGQTFEEGLAKQGVIKMC